MYSGQPYNEKELLLQLENGGREAFSYIFKEYYPALCAFAEKLTGAPQHVEDLVEEVFLKIWLKKQSFHDLKHLRDFLYKATRNACFDLNRRTIHSLERQALFLQNQEQWEQAADLDIIRTEVYRNILEEISRLPEQCSKIVHMGYIEGRSNDEIAQALGLSVQTVKNQKSRGISLLKLRLPPETFALLLLIARL
ncbi:RNA polymerase sigma-70 factor [Niastella caeni]|uniref:RNA polymerase sigma-70 factor n=1 Tax=Niastella caeni TaxID=2569763 RepID=A0A4V4H0B8_9BACT|nr:RNA polymerase sigma-70 factor [Niastella caeni]THU35996.1 RNA polymerase sigma-70 factor [Niastella caeni]